MKRFIAVSFVFALLAVILMAGCGGGGGSTGGVITPPSNPQVSISANPTTITLGASSTLTTSLANSNPATTCTLAGPTNAGPVTCSGTITVTPTATGTATYTVTSNGPGTASSTASVAITVNAPAPTITAVSVTANPTTILAGGTSQGSAVVSGTGSFSSAVTWSVVSGGGLISNPGGLYTAPNNAATVVIRATSTQDTSKSGTATITVNLPPAPTVNVTASAAGIALGQSVTVTVAATNATSCSLKMNGGTAVTVPCNGTNPQTPTTTGVTTFDVTATGLGGTGSGSTMVKVAPVILEVKPVTTYRDGLGITTGYQLNGAGFKLGDTLNCGPICNVSSTQFVNSGQIIIGLAYDTPRYSPGWITFSITDMDGGGTSNVMNMAFLGNQNTLAVGSTGLFQLDQAQGAASGQNGFVRKFDLNGNATGSFFIGALINAVAFDSATGGVTNGSTLDASGSFVGTVMNDGNGTLMGPGARNGIGCTARPSGFVSCYRTNQLNEPMVSASAGNQPWSLTMMDVTISGVPEVDAIVYNRADATLARYTVTNTAGTVSVTLKASLALTAFTLSNQIVSATDGGWQVVAFSTGTAAGSAAVLSSVDKKLCPVAIATMTAPNPCVSLAAVPGVPFRIAADATHGAVIVAFADAPAGLTRFAKVDMATGAVTQLATTSDLLAVGFGASSDGTKLYSCMRGQCKTLPNN